jgi:divalent metal cation (Fe/Co/Zn/Cd) transporter
VATLCIGGLLATIAVLLARETKSLLTVKPRSPSRSTRSAPRRAALRSVPGVEQVIHLRTVHLGPEELLIAGKIGVSSDADGEDITATIDAAEARIRHVLPSARIIYLEPDIYRPEPTH